LRATPSATSATSEHFPELFLVGHPNPAIEGQLKTGHRERPET
jgi:hypothetical protein